MRPWFDGDKFAHTLSAVPANAHGWFRIRTMYLEAHLLHVDVIIDT